MDDTTFAALTQRLTSAIETERARNAPRVRSAPTAAVSDGMEFSRRLDEEERAQGEHWARRRRAEQALAAQQRLHDAGRRAWPPAELPDDAA